jgi:hypothetical protein
MKAVQTRSRRGSNQSFGELVFILILVGHISGVLRVSCNVKYPPDALEGFVDLSAELIFIVRRHDGR